MDSKKDLEKTDAITAIFEHDSFRANPFGSNQSAHRAYRRAERVVAALYLITNHVPDTEPLRQAIRREALKLLDEVLAMKDGMRSVESGSVQACHQSVRNLISFVRMLSVARLLSIQNTQVAVDGLDELSNFIDVSKSSPQSEALQLSRENFLDIGRVHIKDIRDTLAIKDTQTIKDVNASSSRRLSGGEMSVREQHVLSVLSGAGNLGIREIASSLPEYSEKMIQRELASLVASGRVKKEGLKRWSRYSIV